MELNMTDEEANIICHDSSLRRYFYNYLKKGEGLRKELVIIFMYCCIDNGIKLNYSNRMVDIILMAREKLIKNKKIRLFNKKDDQILSNKIKNELKKLWKNEDELCQVYFKLFDGKNERNKKEIMISKGEFSVKIRISKDLQTECGFYRSGYYYRLVDNQKLIGSVIQHNYDNTEIGFLNERGIYYNGQKKWNCIYLR